MVMQRACVRPKLDTAQRQPAVLKTLFTSTGAPLSLQRLLSVLLMLSLCASSPALPGIQAAFITLRGRWPPTPALTLSEPRAAKKQQRHRIPTYTSFLPSVDGPPPPLKGASASAAQGAAAAAKLQRQKMQRTQQHLHLQQQQMQQDQEWQ
ncbi:hypothetical protein ACSSS7_003807 [Eimeria intestinalis]